LEGQVTVRGFRRLVFGGRVNRGLDDLRHKRKDVACGGEVRAILAASRGRDGEERRVVHRRRKRRSVERHRFPRAATSLVWRRGGGAFLFQVLAPSPIPTVIVGFLAVVFTFLVVIARREARWNPWRGIFSSSSLSDDFDTVPLEVDEERDEIWEHITLATSK
jgi:hypothetical protein